MTIFNKFRKLFSKKDKSSTYSRFANKIFIEFLKEEGCKYSILSSDKYFDEIGFKYQGVYFHASLAKTFFNLNIATYRFTSVPFEDLNIIQELCNNSNNNEYKTVLFYDINFNDGKVDISCRLTDTLCDCMLEIEDYVGHLLDLLISEQSTFNRNYLEKSCEDDNKKSSIICQKERHLLRELEISEVKDNFIMELNKDGRLNLEEIFNNIFHEDKTGIRQVDISFPNKPETLHLTDLDEINKLDIYSLIIDQSNGAKEAVMTQGATLTIHFNIPESFGDLATIFLINLEPDTSTESTLYFRMTVCEISKPCARSLSLNNVCREQYQNSMLVGFDLKTRIQKEQEVSFLLNDALDKVEYGYEELTEEQSILVGAAIGDLSYNLYWGRHYFFRKRYLEALTELANIFYTKFDDYNKLSKKQKAIFCEVCYMLGICHEKVGLMTTSYYFYDLAARGNDRNHIKAFIISMVRNNDYRALNVIDENLLKVSSALNPDDDDYIDDALFLNFLYRSRVRHLINFGNYKEAELMLKKMSVEPSCAEFVEKQRNIIRERTHIDIDPEISDDEVDDIDDIINLL